jgi:hypothetical protein
MIRHSNCHNASGEWIPERQRLCDTIHAMGCNAPEFDRLSFVRKFSLRITHGDEPKPVSWRSAHWSGAKACPIRSGHGTDLSILSRTVNAEAFLTLPTSVQCKHCQREIAK